MLYVSSTGPYAYARAKLQAEEFCREYCDRISVTIVNPGEVYGPNDNDLITAGNLIDFARSNPVTVFNGGTSIVYVDDVADGMIAAMERGRNGERYILAGENVTIRRLAELTNELLSLKKIFIAFPTPIVRSVAWLGRMFHLPLPFNPQVFPTRRFIGLQTTARLCASLACDFATQNRRCCRHWNGA